MAENHNTPNFDRDFNAFWQRLSNYTQRAAEIPADEEGSVECFEQRGKWWQEARERQGLSRQQVASRMGVEVDQVRFVELGLSNHQDLQAGFFENYARALGEPNLYQNYLRTYRLR